MGKSGKPGVSSNFSGAMRGNWCRYVCKIVHPLPGSGTGVAVTQHREQTERAARTGSESKEKLRVNTSVSQQRNLQGVMTADSLMPSKWCTDLHF